MDDPLRAQEEFRAELARADAEVRFHSLVQNASEIILVVRSDFSIAYQSPSMERVLGYTPADLLGRSIESLVDPEDGSQLIAALGRVVLEKGSVPRLVDSRWIDATGGDHPVEISVTNRLDEPAVAGLVLNVRDVSAREALARSQAALHQANRLDSVGRLSAGIAHDFNNLIGVIMVSASLLREELAQGEVDRRILDDIEQAAERASRLTRQLLVFSRSTESKPEIVEVDGIVEGLHRMLRRLIGEHIELRCRGNAASSTVKIDPGMLEQVIVNLVVNARDALPEGGTIIVSTERRDVSQANPAGEIPLGHYVLVSVQDDGIGMHQEVVARIFEPFFSTKEVDKGTGLGLAMVHGIVRQNGGYIDVWSEPGEGTRVSLYLPTLSSAVHATEQAVTTTATPCGRGTILLVEDDDTLRRVAARVLDKLGYEVISASDGLDGERLFMERHHEIDLVVTDVVMPRLDGPRLVERMRALEAELPVVYMSGYSDSMLGSIADSDSLLKKPFRPNELVAQVQMVLGDTTQARGST